MLLDLGSFRAASLSGLGRLSGELDLRGHKNLASAPRTAQDPGTFLSRRSGCRTPMPDTEPHMSRSSPTRCTESASVALSLRAAVSIRVGGDPSATTRLSGGPERQTFCQGTRQKGCSLMPESEDGVTRLASCPFAVVWVVLMQTRS